MKIVVVYTYKYLNDDELRIGTLITTIKGKHPTIGEVTEIENSVVRRFHHYFVNIVNIIRLSEEE